MGKQKETIKVSAGEDLLAFIPHIIGYWPENSVVCIGMCGKRLRATMRLDLPRHGTADLDRFARIASAQLASDTTADGCLIAIFAGADWTDPDTPPFGDVHAALRRAFHAHGMPVREAWYVGANHWRSIGCTDADCCPWPGRSNESIAGSFVNAELVYRGSAIDANPGTRIAEVVAVRDQAHVDAVARAARPFRQALEEFGQAESQLCATLGAWEHALAQWPTAPDTVMTAFLLSSLANTTVRDAVLVSLAVTPEQALAGVLGVGRLVEDSHGMVVPMAWHGGSQAAAYDIRIQDESDAALVAAAAAFGDVLVGGGGGAVGGVGGGRPAPTVAPNWPRLDRAQELLEFLAASSMGRDKAAILCMLGWIHWCKGRGTWAGTYFQLSLAASPGYKLAALLEQLLDAGCIAAWAKNQGTAWHGSLDHKDAA
ncbi:DUF4192 domain-containing protein [Specibacter sp. RAF43]|uniref:DUF4192 domain-containing protein n=1 Tax=Specibacter sp. RAF43 TaxID=3233057 RepID=UPI003F9BEE1E